MIGINNETLDNYKKKLALKAMHYRYLSSSFTEFEELAKKYNAILRMNIYRPTEGIDEKSKEFAAKGGEFYVPIHNA